MFQNQITMTSYCHQMKRNFQKVLWHQSIFAMARKNFQQITRVNCSGASFFKIKFFYFQVHYPCKWELFFWTEQRKKLCNWQGKKVRVQTREKLRYQVLHVFDLHQLSSRGYKSLAIMSNLHEINELLHRFFKEYL